MTTPAIRPAAGRTLALIEALEAAALTQEEDGLTLTIESWEPWYSPEGDLRGVTFDVKAEALGEEVPIDRHRRIVNPTPRFVYPDEEIEGLKRIRIDPVAAMFQTLRRSIQQSPNFEAWGLPGQTVTAMLTEANDGYLESADNTYSLAAAGTGSTLNLSATGTDLAAGQWLNISTYRIYEMFLDYDTSAVADDVVSQVDLALWINGLPATDFTARARLYDYGTLGTPNWRTPAQLAALPLLASISTASMTQFQYETFTENGTTFQDSINGSGNTRIVVSSSLHESETAPTTQDLLLTFASEKDDPSLEPLLTITHAAPPAVTSPAWTGSPSGWW